MDLPASASSLKIKVLKQKWNMKCCTTLPSYEKWYESLGRFSKDDCHYNSLTLPETEQW